jgi:hypothetical protein
VSCVIDNPMCRDGVCSNCQLNKVEAERDEARDVACRLLYVAKALDVKANGYTPRLWIIELGLEWLKQRYNDGTEVPSDCCI